GPFVKRVRDCSWLGEGLSPIRRTRRQRVGAPANARRFPDPRSLRGRLLEQVQEAILVLLERPEAVELALELEGLGAVPGRLLEESDDWLGLRGPGGPGRRRRGPPFLCLVSGHPL